MSAWRAWHERNPLRRWLCKSGAFLAVVLLVLFPDPRLLARFVHRLNHLDALVEPGAPELAELEAEVRRQLPDGAGPELALKVAERAVYDRIPYAWDWDNWHVMEYLPTTREALQRGREDCDGRAIVATALLRRMGYEAWLVSDFLHMWVQTPHAELMAPTGHAKTLSAEPGSMRTTARFDPGLFANLARGFIYGVNVFPLLREIIILLAVIGLTWHPRLGGRRALAGVAILLAGFALLRTVGARAAVSDSALLLAVSGLGMLLAIAGWGVIAAKGVTRRRRSEPAPPE